MELADGDGRFLDDIQVDWITPTNEKNDASSPGMSPFERRKYQIQLNKKNEPPYVFWKTEFEELRQSEWEYPYHMIDFETTTVAIPYFKGMHPFETIAFQFSHHILYENDEQALNELANYLVDKRNVNIRCDESITDSESFMKIVENKLSWVIKENKHSTKSGIIKRTFPEMVIKL
jgi:hypothetical protein